MSKTIINFPERIGAVPLEVHFNGEEVVSCNYSFLKSFMTMRDDKFLHELLLLVDSDPDKPIE